MGAARARRAAVRDLENIVIDCKTGKIGNCGVVELKLLNRCLLICLWDAETVGQVNARHV